jgi:hypothetical protein
MHTLPLVHWFPQVPQFVMLVLTFASHPSALLALQFA